MFSFFLFKWTLYCSKRSPSGCAWNKLSHLTDLVVLDVGLCFGFSPAKYTVRRIFFPVFFCFFFFFPLPFLLLKSKHS